VTPEEKTPFPAATESGVQKTPKEGAEPTSNSIDFPEIGQASGILEGWKTSGRKPNRAPIKISTKRPVAEITAEVVKLIPLFNNPPILFTKDRSVRVVEKDGGSIRLDEVDVNILSHHLDRWFRFVDSDSGRTNKGAPLRVVRDLLALPQLPFPELERITTAPFFDKAGSYWCLPGFHNGTLLLGKRLERKKIWTPVESLRYLKEELLGDFPFESPADGTMALALGVTVLARELIDGPTPLFSIEAPQAGTGKTLLVRSILQSILGSPYGWNHMSADISNEEEWRKRLFSVMLLGLPVLVLDNLSIPLNSSSLSSILTSQSYTDRLLGRSSTASIQVRNVWILTGNNPSFSSELARRVVTIRLNAASESPQHRSGFKYVDLYAWVTEHQAELIGAWASLVQNWIKQGKPLYSGKTLGGFEAWVQTVGGILEVNGVTGFLEGQSNKTIVHDIETEALQAFIQTWWDKFSNQIVESMKDLVPIARSIDGWDLGRREDQNLSIALGKKLNSIRSRRFRTPNGLVAVQFLTRVHGKSRYQLALIG